SLNTNKKEKIQVDDFNTAALDDLLGGGQKNAPQRAGTMGAINNQQDEDEWDPFANKGENVYSTQQPAQVPEQPQRSGGGASNNIFGDDENDMWGDNPNTGNQQTHTKQ